MPWALEEASKVGTDSDAGELRVAVADDQQVLREESDLPVDDGTWVNGTTQTGPDRVSQKNSRSSDARFLEIVIRRVSRTSRWRLIDFRNPFARHIGA